MASIVSLYGADIVRWIAISLGCLNLGTVLALYNRAWRYATPTWAVRLITIGGAGILVGLMISTLDAMGKPLTWRGPFLLSSELCYLAGLIWMYAWFRLPEGRKFRHTMVNEYATRRLMRMAKHVEKVDEDA